MPVANVVGAMLSHSIGVPVSATHCVPNQLLASAKWSYSKTFREVKNKVLNQKHTELENALEMNLTNDLKSQESGQSLTRP